MEPQKKNAMNWPVPLPPCIRTWRNSGFCKQLCIENSQQNIDSEAKSIQDSLLGHPCKCRVQCDCWPGNTLVTGNSPCSPGSRFPSPSTATASFPPWATPWDSLLDSQDLPAYFKDPVRTFLQFSTWLLSFHFPVAHATSVAHIHSYDGGTPRGLWGSYRLARLPSSCQEDQWSYYCLE